MSNYLKNLTVPAALTLVLAVSGPTGCDRRLEAYVPADQEPPAPERPVRIPGLAIPNPNMGQNRPSSLPQAMGQAQPGTRSGTGGEPIRGQVRLGADARNPGRGVLFVIARSGVGGPPLAVKRLAAGPFPMAFELGPGDVMIQGRPFSGKLTLTARVDVDSDPLTRDPEDLEASLEQPVEPGARGIDLVLKPPSR